MLSSLLFILVSVWVLLSLLLFFFQSQYIYQPYKGVTSTPAEINLDYEEVNFKAKDGVELHGWWIPHADAEYTLLFLHGNAGNISHRLHSLEIFNKLGVSIFILDYRGYGNSEGKPGEQGTYHDAEAAWQYLVNKKNIDPDRIIIFGRSLGGAVASWLATRYNAAAVILESTFTSVADMGSHYYPYLPIKLINHIKYDTLERINAIKSPLLIIHSREDEIVPFRFSEQLYAAANEPKHFLEIDGDHNYGYQESHQIYREGLLKFINYLNER
ncbi:MAG: alpha/beta fold hydrolase [Gammaproteobacteria bacterium]